MGAPFGPLRPAPGTKLNLLVPDHKPSDDRVRLVVGRARPGSAITDGSVYTCRHTFATWALQGGKGLFDLSRIMGTSIAMLDVHYGHLVPDSKEYLRGLLDTYDGREAVEGVADDVRRTERAREGVAALTTPCYGSIVGRLQIGGRGGVRCGFALP